MGDSAVQDDPMLRLKYYQQTGQADEAKQYETYLRQTNQYRDSTAAPVSQPSPVAVQHGAAPRQPIDIPEGTKPLGPVDKFLTHVLNVEQGIPGMEAVQAGLGALFSHIPKSVPLIGRDHPISYTDALQGLRGSTGEISGPVSMAEHIGGASLLLPFLPANPALAGGLLGGADQALSADPINSAEDVGWRAAKTVAGAGIGAGIGKLADAAVTAGRAKMAGSSAANVIKREAERAATASTNYGKALAEGQGAEVTQAVQAQLQRPEVKAITRRLLSLDQFKGMDAHSPEVLDAVYKTLSDQAKDLQKGLAQVTPSQAATRRYSFNQIKSIQNDLLSAMEATGTKTSTIPATIVNVPARETAQSPNPSIREALDAFQRRVGVAAARTEGTPAQQLARQALERHSAENIAAPALRGAPNAAMAVETAPAQTVTSQLPAMMPSYRTAVERFAGDTKLIEAVQRGSDIIKRAGTALQSGKNLGRTSTEAFQKWASSASPDQLQAASEGILGGLNQVEKVKWAKVLGLPILPHFTPQMSQAMGLLRTVKPGASNLATAGLLSVYGMQK